MVITSRLSRLDMDHSFEMISIDWQETGDSVELGELRDVYDMRLFKLYAYLHSNHYEKYVDLEDEEFRSLKVRRFVQSTPQDTEYVEINADYLANVDYNSRRMVDQILNCQERKKYLSYVALDKQNV